ncbi:MAG TPA: type II CAAX endopeptidase family protein [Candidatus Angelobacter sp.]|nr:type II CAAX endopeptidase family protein [Candidatus Angelobacter sp.]
MNAPTVAQPMPAIPKPIAPIWHTVLFLFAVGGIATWGAHRQGLAAFGASRTTGYLFTMAWEWLLFALAAWGIRLGGGSIQEVIGGRWSTTKQFWGDLGIGILFLIGSNVVLAGLQAILRPGFNPNVARLLPHSRTEITLWMLLSLSAGICEEFIFRGYLQRQLNGWLKNATVAVLIQGVIFGAAHAYQGLKLVLTIVVLGSLIGWLAQWRKSTRPGMISHFLQDAMGGIVLGRH